MKKIAHISDLHFGTEAKNIAEGLVIDLKTIAPALIAISGDLTQRARGNQFKAAKDYLDRLPKPQIVTPGNHDIPLFDVFRRFFLPLARYKKFITENLNPIYEDEEMAVLAINTARSLTWKNGRISAGQISLMEKKLCSISNDKFKIIVTHHPFIPPPGDPGIELVGRSVKALNIIDKCKVDLLLAGHLHHGYSGDIRPYYPARERSVISAQAGTAISKRVRSEKNAYNLITVDKDYIEIAIRVWNGKIFEESVKILYKRIGLEWVREE